MTSFRKSHLTCIAVLAAVLAAAESAASAGGSRRVRRAATRSPNCRPAETMPMPHHRDARMLSVYYYEGEGFYLQEGCVDPNATAYGYFSPSVNSTGWDVLEVVAAASGAAADGDNRMTMFAAGLLEGLLTADRVEAHFANVRDDLMPEGSKRRSLLPQLRTWLREQADWAQNFSDSNPADPLARSVGYVLAQLQGLINGFFFASDLPYDPFVLHLTNAAADAADVLSVLANDWPNWEKISTGEFASFVERSGHCSALVKLLPGLEDLLMGHSTWNSYSATLRTFKHYDFRLTDASVVGGRMSFGGYPGTLASLDAFYAIGGDRLALLQTTNGVYNASLFSSVGPHSLLAWQRVRAANQIATSGAHWAVQFARYNSGTYNNQYMLLDMDRFRPGVALDNGALTVVEQIPGLVRYSDQTPILRTGYWPSYNVPFHEDIYQLSGYPDVVRKHGLDFSYQMAPRAKILRRDAVTASDLDSMRSLMRSNRYRVDPYSAGNPCKCICCRGDLLGRGAFGCYDAKVTSHRQLRVNAASSSSSSTVWAISGPTTSDGLPVFSWSAFGNVSHRLLPAAYNFSWVAMRPTLLLSPLD